MKNHRARFSALGVGLLIAMAGAHGAQDDPRSSPAATRTYALVAAVGGQVDFVTQTSSLGSHLPPYRRTSTSSNDGLLDRMALRGLDRAIEHSDPHSGRAYFALPARDVDDVPADRREDAVIAEVVEQLSPRPERRSWYRIVVVTPAYKAGEMNAMANRLHGLGVFTQPRRGGTWDSPEGSVDLDRQAGVKVQTPGGHEFRSQAFVAPYSYIEVWVIDPRTMKVLDRRREFESRKFGDPSASDHDAHQGLTDTFMFGQLDGLLVHSIDHAVATSELALKKGSVTVVQPPLDDPLGEKLQGH